MGAFTIIMKRVNTILNHLSPAEASSSPAAGKAALLCKGQVAVVTGSGQGIGREAALLFAQLGAQVCVSDLDESKSEAVAAEIRAQGGEAISVAGDVTDPEYPERVLSQTVQHFGKVTVVVNNAGYTWDAVIHKMTDKQWDAMIAVHQTAVFRMLRACGKYMREPAKKVLEQGGIPEGRCIINISSTTGTHGNSGQLNYSGAKAAVVGMTKTVAKEWGAFNIRCNCIAFGRIATRLTAEKKGGASITVDGQKIALGIPNASKADFSMIPMRRAGTPQEAGASIVMLASPLASY